MSKKKTSKKKVTHLSRHRNKVKTKKQEDKPAEPKYKFLPARPYARWESGKCLWSEKEQIQKFIAAGFEPFSAAVCLGENTENKEDFHIFFKRELTVVENKDSK